MKPLDHNWLFREIRRRWGMPSGKRQPPRNYPQQLVRHFESNDGQRLLARPILPDDAQRLKDAFEALSPESIYRRFHTHLQELADEQCRYLTEIDYESHMALVALDESADRIVGVARYYRPENSPLAEAAVVVADDWQHRGVGRYLLSQLHVVAMDHGIVGFEAFVQSDNHRMLGILQRSGLKLRMIREHDCVRILTVFDD